MNRKNYIFLIIAFITLLLSFHSNFFHLVPQKAFESFDIYDKGFVYGRIMNAEEKGFFSDGCFTGLRYDTAKINIKGRVHKDSAFVMVIQSMVDQKDMYQGKMDVGPDYGPYFTQIGTMASLYSIINTTISASPDTKLSIFDCINAFINALVFMLFFWWILKEYGTIPAIVTLCFLLISSWFISFCGNLWWIAGSFYLPIFGMFLMLRSKLPEKKILLYLFLLFLAKAILTGFEFISCAFLSVFIPIIYYYYYNKKSFKEFFIFSFKAGIVCLLALLVMSFILILQHKSYYGTYSAGVDWLYNAFLRRSGDKADSNGILYNLGYIQVVYHWFREIFDLSELTDAIRIPFTVIISTIYINMIILYQLTKKAINSRKYKALILATALSYIPSVSWYIIFRNHALEHMHIDSICWYFPFLLLGFISLGVTVSIIYKRLTKSKDIFIEDNH